VDELRRRSKALRSYVARREHKPELAAAERWSELRIGEVLGPGKVGRPTKDDEEATLVSVISRDDRARFRLMAKHMKLVVKLLTNGVVSRNKILAAINAKSRGEKAARAAKGQRRNVTAPGRSTGTARTSRIAPWRRLARPGEQRNLPRLPSPFL
jgi:hypothetical protein